MKHNTFFLSLFIFVSALVLSTVSASKVTATTPPPQYFQIPPPTSTPTPTSTVPTPTAVSTPPPQYFQIPPPTPTPTSTVAPPETAVFPPASTTYDGTDQLHPGERLQVGHYLRSHNNKFFLLMQGDGNLVLYEEHGQALWSSQTGGSGASYLELQNDGNVVLYRPDGTAVWAAGTRGYPTGRLQVQDDAQLGAWASETFLWSSSNGLLVPSAAQSTFVTGKLRYKDTNSLRPIVQARVQVHRFAPHIGPIWTWAVDAETKTNNDGTFSVALPYVTDDVIYALRVFSENDVAIVYVGSSSPNDIARYQTFPLATDGQEMKHVVHSPGQTVRFDYDFSNFVDVYHFNIADTLRYGRAYALANRDPRESESLPKVGVRPGQTIVGGSWYYPLSDSINLSDEDVMDDGTILHEYAHFLQDQMGSIPWNMVNHTGCETTDIFGDIVNSAGHEWMEGFADYFAGVIVENTSYGLTGDHSSYKPLYLDHPEYFAKCTVDNEPHEIERYVASVLWDLHDTTNELGDTVAGLHKDIFQAFDRELDMATSIAGPFPTLLNLKDALINRGVLTLDAWNSIASLNAAAVTGNGGTIQNTSLFQIQSSDSFTSLAEEIAVGDWVIGEKTVENAAMDIDGNGIRDLVRFFASPSGKTMVDIVFSDGMTFYRSDGASPVDVGGWESNGERVQETSLDMNGDGKEDLLRIFKSDTNQAMVDVLYSNGTSLYRPVDPPPSAIHIGDWSLNGERVKRIPMYVNNDTKQDLVSIYRDGNGKAMVDILFSNGESFYLPGPTNPLDVGGWAESGAGVQNLVLDVNGDRQEDLVRIWKRYDGKAMTDILYSNGTGFYRPANPVALDIGGWTSGNETVQIFAMDIDGNGKGDLVRVLKEPHGWIADLLYSNGTSFYRPDNAVPTELGSTENKMLINSSKPLSDKASLFRLHKVDTQAYVQSLSLW